MIDKRAEQVLKNLKTKNSAYWEKVRKKKALELFKKASKEVSAYKEFLKKKKVKSNTVKSWDHFQELPKVNKHNYLKKYPFERLTTKGTLKQPIVFSSTSGSTGDPFYFPRDEKLDWEYSIFVESFLKSVSGGSNQTTLVVVAFGMGVWIGGLITYRAFEILSHRGQPLSIITPGINKKEIFNALRKLAPNYDQTIIIGYPPFLKDIVDECDAENINLKILNLKLLFAAETFTEDFRNYICEKGKIKNPLTDTLNIYGTAELGAMAFETPTTVLLRRLIVDNPELQRDIFGDTNHVPTLAQYNPEFVCFESINGEIIITADNTFPLVRYSVGDHGEVLSFSEVDRIFKKHNVNYIKEAKSLRIPIFELPLVYVHERVDLSTTLYGLQIYPDTIREVLLRDEFQNLLTGRFTMLTKFNGKQDQYLEINIELKPDKLADTDSRRSLLEEIISNLQEKNSEFRELSDFLGKRAKPKLVFWQHEDPLYFKQGIKQRWVQK